MKENKEKEILILDRIEGDFAVCQDVNMEIFNINIHKIKGTLKEGCVIIKENNNYFIDEEKTLKRREKIKDLMKGLWQE